MAKNTVFYLCAYCSYRTPKWVGCCPECNQWNTLMQETPVSPSVHATGKHPPATLTLLQDVRLEKQQRMTSGIEEWDRVMGGGIVPGSFLILTGDPGIGKSTLLLHVCDALAAQYTVWYFATEESLPQVKLRAHRLGTLHERLLFSDEVKLESILESIVQQKPHMVIIDSIQNCITDKADSFPGSVGQLREAAFALMRVAKEHNVTVLVSGHITKEGTMAGPKLLEHMVDAVFYLHGQEQWHTRVLRSVKNRFGTIDELGFFEMGSQGLVQVPNINEHIVKEVSHSPGSVLVSTMEGSRPLLIELQALTIESKLAVPQRVISGVDHKQVVLIAAILEKYLKVRLSAHDIFFKISGGLRINESSADLAIALALISSYLQQPLPPKSLALGEVSLTGKIKPVGHINAFVKEAEKFGITHLLTAKGQSETNSKARAFSSIYELLTLFDV